MFCRVILNDGLSPFGAGDEGVHPCPFRYVGACHHGIPFEASPSDDVSCRLTCAKAPFKEIVVGASPVDAEKVTT